MRLPTLDTNTASAFARLALAGVAREYPHKPDHVLTAAADVRSPRECHPLFYGCYDWHSAVHSHWLLVRLWRCFEDLPERGEIAARLAASFQPAHFQAERDYAAAAERVAFERPYGWAWLFKLAEELHTATGPEAKAWSAAMRPLVELFCSRLLDWLPRQRYPVRVGLHGNTAFMLGFASDYARTTENAQMTQVVRAAALRFFAGDRVAPCQWEPGGNDFLSPSLVEADLMRRVLGEDEFRAWLESWLPDLTNSTLLQPVDVTDRSDPQGGHLDGLNLSRAWCLMHLANRVATDGALHRVLVQAASDHLFAALPHVQSGNFLGEHWLATFALYAMTSEG